MHRYMYIACLNCEVPTVVASISNNTYKLLCSVNIDIETLPGWACYWTVLLD